MPLFAQYKHCKKYFGGFSFIKYVSQTKQKNILFDYCEVKINLIIFLYGVFEYTFHSYSILYTIPFQSY